MEGKEGKGGRDAGQDKRINTEGSKQEECCDDKKKTEIGERKSCRQDLRVDVQ